MKLGFEIENKFYNMVFEIIPDLSIFFIEHLCSIESTYF